MSRFRFFVDVKALFWAILFVVLFNDPLGDFAVKIITALQQAPDAQSLGSQLLVGIVGSLIATVLLIGIAAWALPRMQRHRVTGRFKACQVMGVGTDQEVEEEWGDGEIRYDALSFDRIGGIPVRVSLKHTRDENDSIELMGTGVLINNSYLAGYYTETGKPERRRAGGFCYRLMGDGNSWEGYFSFFSPETDGPQYGYVRWRRE